MKTATEPTFVRTDNVGETKRASIRASSMMFNLLSKQIYSDHYTAIWRELVANAIDAQKTTGETRSPVVTVPSILEPYAKVRDFGCSMSHDFMMDQFMAFGDASTKEQSNDFIGGFGIGSKAPLSYTEQYSIRCFLDGKVRVYSIFKDDEGCPSIAFLSEDDTTEPNGVEVGFPVRQDDISSFTNTVVQTLQYFDPLPVLENTHLKIDPIEYDAQGKNWGLHVTGPNRSPKVIVGGVAYPLETHRIPFNGYDNLRQFASLGLDIWVGIGEVEIAASRESVVHDVALFNKLEAIVAGIGGEFGKQLSQQFAKCKTEWDAKLMLCEAVKNAGYNTSRLLRKYAYWNGAKIAQTIRKPDDFEVLIIAYGDFPYDVGLQSIPTTRAVSPKFRSWDPNGRFEPTTFNRIVIDDADDKPSLRIRAVIEKYPDERILFLRDNTRDDDPDIDWAKYLKALGSPPSSMIDKLNDYEPVKVVRSTKGNSFRLFRCYTGTTVPHRMQQSNVLNDLPTGGGLYIQMDNFFPLSSSEEIEVAQQSKPANIIWLNKTDYISSGVKDDPNWYSVEQGMAKVKAVYRGKHKKLPAAEAYYQLRRLKSGGILSEIDNLAKLPSFPKQGPLFQLHKLFLEYNSVATREHSHIRSKLFDVKFDKHLDRMKLIVEKAKAKHPLLFEVCGNWQIRRYASKEMLDRLF